MELTIVDQKAFSGVQAAFNNREVFTLTGAGLTACFVAAQLSFSPQGYNKPDAAITLELRQTGIVTQEEPTAWNGEGLPPVGLEVEIKPIGHSDWTPAKILFAQDHALVFAWKAEGVTWPTTLDAVDVRPIRTAEQIAADERLHKVRNALSTIKATALFPNDAGRQSILVAAVEAMIDAGYRKP